MESLSQCLCRPSCCVTVKAWCKSTGNALITVKAWCKSTGNRTGNSEGMV